MNKIVSTFILVFSLSPIYLSTPATSASALSPEHNQQAHQLISTLPNHAAIASAHPLATKAGLETLSNGGNAFDAAITVAAVLGVVEPYSAGLGGGGFWMLHTAKNHQTIMVDARERAPLAATPTLYFDPKTQTVNRDQAINGATAAGIPGQPAAIAHIAKHYGKLPLQQSLKAAIEIAKQGYPVDEVYLQLLDYRLEVLKRNSEANAIFLRNGKPPQLKQLIKQPELASTLTTIAQQGHDGFYKGALAQELIRSVQAAGGIWQPEDFMLYQVIERQPVVGHYFDKKIITAAPPSAGGILLIQMLNMLSNFDLSTLSDIEHTHLITEVMRRAYQTRALWLGDEDYVFIPKERLMSKTFADDLIANFSFSHITPSTHLMTDIEKQNLSAIEQAQQNKGQHTTHFSVLDKEGNRVSATLSINLPFGSGFVAGNTGVLLNNEMDDFDAAPGFPNAYGLVGSGANSIAPGKRPLSSMSPTFIESKSSISILGTPGGSRIISMVLLGILEASDDKPVNQWVSRKRFHHQFLPDRLQHEPSTFSKETLAALAKLGHQLKNVNRSYGNMQAIHWDLKTGHVMAASDPRRIGLAITQEIK